jgi:hypothetical protein
LHQEQTGKAKSVSAQSNRKITEWYKPNDSVEKEAATLVAEEMDVAGEIPEIPSISINVALEMVKKHQNYYQLAKREGFGKAFKI